MRRPDRLIILDGSVFLFRPNGLLRFDEKSECLGFFNPGLISWLLKMEKLLLVLFAEKMMIQMHIIACRMVEQYVAHKKPWDFQASFVCA